MELHKLESTYAVFLVGLGGVEERMRSGYGYGLKF